MARTILIVDDEESIRTSLKGALEDEGFDVITTEDGNKGIATASDELPDLILLDIWMPGIDGIETLNRLQRLLPKIPVVMMSGHGNIEVAVKATRLGAYDFIEKPLSLEKVMITIRHAMETSMLEQENLILKGEERHQIKGETNVIKKLRGEIESMARSDGGVLITGESGTGKEIVAWNIHNLSSRANKPFIAFNCGSVPVELLESELFGYEKGAFTGATSHRKGKFDMAHEGTLYLSEVADISPDAQLKLLRVMQEDKFERVGGTRKIKVDVRVMAGSTKNLIEEKAAGRFDGKLLSCLDAHTVHIPPLRERVGDIPLLVEHFINEFSSASAKTPKRLLPDAMGLLKMYSWPGNVRELRNVIERLAIIAPSDIIEPDHIPQYLRGPENTLKDIFALNSFREAMQRFEKEFILKRLGENGWNISKTAEAIGLERSLLSRKVKMFEIGIPD